MGASSTQGMYSADLDRRRNIREPSRFQLAFPEARIALSYLKVTRLRVIVGDKETGQGVYEAGSNYYRKRIAVYRSEEKSQERRGVGVVVVVVCCNRQDSWCFVGCTRQFSWPLENSGRNEALRPQRRPAKTGRHVLSVASEAWLWRPCLRISKCGWHCRSFSRRQAGQSAAGIVALVQGMG